MADGKQIGQMNGKWAWAAKFGLATYPFLLAWGAWATVALIRLETFADVGERFTKSDAKILVAEMHEWVNDKIDREVPPPDVTRRLDGLETITKETRTEVQKIAVTLASIESRMPLLSSGP